MIRLITSELLLIGQLETFRCCNRGGWHRVEIWICPDNLIEEMSAENPSSPQPPQGGPAQPGKAFLGVLGLICGFYLVDCLLVTIFQDHPSTPWIEWGIHARGPAGFGITVIAFFVGIFVWLKEVAKKADEERHGPAQHHPPASSGSDKPRSL